MHGSINHQVTVVFQESGIFRPGESKHFAKIEAKEELAQEGKSATSSNISEKISIYSYATAEKYKDTWHSVANFCKQEFGIKDITKIEGEHIQAYLEKKIGEGVKYSTFQRECAAISKFEQALNRFAELVGDKYGASKTEFNFKEAIETAREVAKETLNRDLKFRGFENPQEVINNLKSFENKLVASIQLEGGARISEACYIKENQLKGIVIDNITGKEVGKIHLENTKGGKERDIIVSKETYNKLENYIKENIELRVNKNTYSHDINRSAREVGEKAIDTHSFRYCYAQERYSSYLGAGYTHEQAIQGISWEMGHERADITLHYLR